MKKEIKYHQLGATLYLSAIHPNLFNTILKNKYQNLKSIVICLEDALEKEKIEEGFKNVKQILNLLDFKKELKIFIRPRNIKMLTELLELRNIYKIDGFSLPKFDTTNISEYLNIFRKYNDFYFMPILETKDVFSQEKLLEIAIALEPFKERILTIRLGSEDILNLLKIRRNQKNIYEILPFHMVLSNVITIFKPLGFNISGPVYNNIKVDEILKKEILKEKEYGIYNKTIIHPNHINIIQELYKVSKEDFDISKRIVEKKEAVFAENDNMYEYKTHKNWAKSIINLGTEYGQK